MAMSVALILTFPLGSRDFTPLHPARASVNPVYSAPESARQSLLSLRKWRKVRAPQGKAPGNAWEARAYGKCRRKYTA